MSIVTDSNGNVQTVNFYEVSPTFDSMPAPTLIVNATNEANAINYSEGKSTFANFFATPPVLDPAWGEVSVDNQEPIEFTNKDHLIINGLAGDDQTNLNNPNKPAGPPPRRSLRHHRQWQRPDRQRHPDRERHDWRGHALTLRRPRPMAADHRRRPGAHHLYHRRARDHQRPGRQRHPDRNRYCG